MLRAGTWRTVFWVLAGVGALLFVLAALVIRETLPPDRRSGGGFGTTLHAFGTLLRDRGYLGCVLAGSMVTAAMFGYISASPFLLQEGFGVTAQWFSACFALNAIGIVLATQIGRLMLRRTTSFALLSWGVGQSLTGAVLLAAAVLVGWGLPMVLLALFVMVSAVGFALPHASAIAMDRHRQDRRLGLGPARALAVRVGRRHGAARRPGRRRFGDRARRHRSGVDAGRGGRAAGRASGDPACRATSEPARLASGGATGSAGRHVSLRRSGPDPARFSTPVPGKNHHVGYAGGAPR